MAHAPFAPSAADRWLECPGSFGLSLHLPDPPEGDYAAEGTRLHEAAANLLLRQPVTVLKNDTDFLAPYVSHCIELMRGAPWHAIEQRVEHSTVLHGTADFRCLDKHGDLHIVDLKTGQGIMVDPKENSQLLIYAYMTVVEQGLTWGERKVHLTIVQPPDTEKPVKTWSTTADYVASFGARVETAITEILGGKSDLVPGEHCRWCKAKPTCPKLRGEVDTLPVDMHVAELGALATSLILDKADLVLQFIDAVRAHAHSLATRGVEVPGWTLKPKRATRQWADEEKVLEIARRRKIKIWQDKLMSPAMAEKAHPTLPAELREQIVAVSSGTNLVRDTSAPRESTAPTGPSLEGALKNLIYRI